MTEALRSSHHVRDLFVTAEVLARQTGLVQAARDSGVEVTVVGDRVAGALSETVHPQGATAVVEIGATDLDAMLATSPRLLVVLEGVADPGNAGTIIRTAAAAGADAVVFCQGSVDPYGGKCVRATAGALLHLPIVVGADLDDVIDQVRAHGLAVLAADIGGRDVFELGDDLRRPTAWLFGSESHGLDARTVASADAAVRIPMTQRVESLNLAAAAAICLYASAKAMSADHE